MKRSAYWDKYHIVYFHGRILWRLSDLRSTPHILADVSKLSFGDFKPVLEMGITVEFAT